MTKCNKILKKHGKNCVKVWTLFETKANHFVAEEKIPELQISVDDAPVMHVLNSLERLLHEIRNFAFIQSPLPFEELHHCLRIAKKTTTRTDPIRSNFSPPCLCAWVVRKPHQTNCKPVPMRIHKFEIAEIVFMQEIWHLFSLAAGLRIIPGACIKILRAHWRCYATQWMANLVNVIFRLNIRDSMRSPPILYPPPLAVKPGRVQWCVETIAMR